jgi:WhiB family redox-sensing transcriptional regulator
MGIDDGRLAWNHRDMNHPSASPGFEWRERAACLPHPTVLFFGVDDNETAVEKHTREDEAKRICALCDVRQECLDHALAAREPYGIWGGLNEIERRQLLHTRAS